MDQDAIDKSELNFGTREQCVVYLDELLRHKMFHRAKKIPVAEKVSKKDKKDKDKGKNYDSYSLRRHYFTWGNECKKREFSNLCTHSA